MIKPNLPMAEGFFVPWHFSIFAKNQGMNTLQLVFSDAHYWSVFRPLTLTRPVAGMRCGVLTFAERWQKLLGLEKVAYSTEKYLEAKFPAPEKCESLVIVANFLPDETALEQIKNLKQGEALVHRDELVVARMDLQDFQLSQITRMEDISAGILWFEQPTDLFSHNQKAIDFDFKLLTEGRTSQPLSSTNILIGPAEDLFVEEGAEIEAATLNTKTGKIYIGKNAEVMEGSHLRGPIALCEGSKFNLGSKVYGPTTIGPHSKIGGEVNNIVVFGYSNKGHDGFVGNSVIGEWCNLGADTNSSNLKNNYAEVKLYSYATQKMEATGLQFCGLIMGDHAKTAINTQLNTGTVVGVGANIFKPGFPPNYVPEFSWGGGRHDEKFKFEKALEVAEKAMARRKVPLTEEDVQILKTVYGH